jgi:hypothetical protein
MAGHTAEWVQLSGTTVEFLTDPNSVEASFAQSANRDDKVFRFYLDRDTSFEQYRDVLVTPTARDTTNVNQLATFSGSISNYTNFGTAVSTITINGVGSTPPNTATFNTLPYTLSWVVPSVTYPILYTSIDVYGYDGSSYVLIGNFPAATTSTTLNQIYTSFKFRTNFNLYTTPLFPNYVDSAVFPNNYEYMLGADETNSNISSTGIGNISKYQTQILTLSANLYVDTTNSFVTATASGNIVKYQTQILSLIPLPELPEDTTTMYVNSVIAGTIQIYQRQVSAGLTHL